MYKSRNLLVTLGALGAGVALTTLMRKIPPEQRAQLVAATATGSFAVLLAGLAAAPGKRWVDEAGIGFHAAMLPLIALLPAPAWAKAMGQGWVAIDVAVSGASLNGWPKTQGTPLRLGGHLLAAGWIAGASQGMATPLRWGGRAVAATLGGHTLLGGATPKPVLLMASGPLQLAWLAGITTALIRRGDTA